ncbi:ArsR family transcriptional regulator [Paenibacillus sp. EZ-K15]|uniref:ArsR family transcriptional regulator n=1 Tax=Paenibacillus sp. EZ-K15 TaxID=2044275 RepID=UPI001F022575|nr:ArsR family transcriptional regulator [Paenibacillus sp. EZ-K15]
MREHISHPNNVTHFCRSWSNIVELLKKGPKSVREIVKALGISQPHVSCLLLVLSEAGIVRSRSKAQLRIYLSSKSVSIILRSKSWTTRKRRNYDRYQ